jgi:iron-sulfur cluster insertion protein|tara:strand:- start:1266 stop:1658 length:393 start_codon:yes stop_codon:yes gene_type:complete
LNIIVFIYIRIAKQSINTKKEIKMSIVTLTESAIKQMDSMLLEHSKPAIRLELQGGGCSGFKYNWTLEDNLEERDEVIDLPNGKFAIDNSSIMYLLGSVVDYKKEVFGSYFDIQNPTATSSCGCGESIGF